MRNKDWVKCVLCDDSRNVIKRIPDNSIDFILTDPPYNIGKHSTGNIPLPGRTPMNNDVADWDWVDFNPEEWIDDFIRILKPDGNLFIFTSYNQIGRWYNGLDHRFDTTNFMIWHKTNPAPKIYKAGFLNSCEMIFTCWNKGHKWNFISQAEMHNFFESPICMRPERLSNPKHPAQKPIALLKKLITIASNPGDIIFDPFMGVGSTGVAALQLDRRFIGIEINPTYFMAAKARIEGEIKNSHVNENVVSEPLAAYPTTTDTIDFLSLIESENAQVDAGEVVLMPKPYKEGCSSQLKPILKWAGGKEKELKYILPNVPGHFTNYYEPFVGGGAVFMAINAERYFINDLSDELISLYRFIKNNDHDFFEYVNQINSSWIKAGAFVDTHGFINDTYSKYRAGEISDEELKSRITQFCNDATEDIKALLGLSFINEYEILAAEVNTNLFRKMKRMRELENLKHSLPPKDIADNLETAIKSALYMFYRNMYNRSKSNITDEALHCSLFLFIRNYCYSGMFRYNDKGDFNVPYGGIAYNSKTMSKKIDYYRSQPVADHMEDTGIYNLDFEIFLRQINPSPDDFIFLDPPYDSRFSTYSQNKFSKNDHRRLSEYLLSECRAKWMLVIKYTEFIYELYNKPGVNIRTFEKEYLVSFMNRNDKKAQHLLITNY